MGAGLLGAIVAGVAGLILAGLAGFGVINAASTNNSPITNPLVVYGSR